MVTPVTRAPWTTGEETGLGSRRQDTPPPGIERAQAGRARGGAWYGRSAADSTCRRLGRELRPYRLGCVLADGTGARREGGDVVRRASAPPTPGAGAAALPAVDAGLYALSMLAVPLALLAPVPLKIVVDSVLGTQPVPPVSTRSSRPAPTRRSSSPPPCCS